MANVVVTIKVMPESVELDLEELQLRVLSKVKDFAGDTDSKVEIEPIAFGLKALRIMFVLDESKGSTEVLEDSISHLDGVQSIEVVDVRRAVG